MAAEPVTVPEAVRRQAALRPGAVALRDPRGSLTYGELVDRADRLAAALALAPGDRVAVCAGRSVDTAVAMLAVLAAGGACVPLDPAYPPERRSSMAADSGCTVALVDGARGAAAAGATAALPEGVDRVDVRTDPGPAAGLLPDVPGDQVAMVLYTSGSTGRPKGVMITHRNVLALVGGHEALRHRPGDVVAHVLSSSFDAVLLDLWGALAGGATCYLPPDEAATSPGHLLDALDGAGITTLPVTSSLFHQLVALRPEVVRELRSVWFGGEAADAAVARSVGGGVRLVHHYGPTECTSISTVHVVGPGDAGSAVVPIGCGLDTVRLHVVDDALRPVADGVVGELVIGGPQVALGYLGRPRLTADRFLPDPFSDAPGARLYRTGDLVRRPPDGELLFVSRADDQVKVRGFRVEPAEVAACLRPVGGVRDVAVVARDDGAGQARLVAYVVGDPGAEPRLRAAAERRLPEPMQPTAYVPVDEIPRLVTGKVDVRALPPPPVRQPEVALTGTEQRLGELWCDVLGVPAVAPEDDFFALGGYSLLAARLAARIEADLGATVPLRAFFEARTLRDLAAVVDRRARPPASAPAPPAGADGAAPRLSPGQRELWLLDRLRPGSSAYNSPMAFRITGDLDVDALQRGLDEIVARHEVLRWSFPAVDGRPEVAVAPPGRVDLVVEQGEAGLDDAAVVAWAAGRREEPFDLQRGPLLRARLLRLAPDDAALLVTVHHIVFDGWSFQLFVQELSALYAAFTQGRPSPLAPLRLSYGDLVRQGEQRLASGELDGQIDHWRQALTGAPPAIDLPPGDPGAARDSAVVVRSVIDGEVGRLVHQVAARGTATPFMTLLAALHLGLHALTGADDAVVASPNAGRRSAGSSEAIGYFIQLLPLRLTIAPGSSLRDLLDRARATAVGAFDNQDVPFERIVHELRPPRSRSRRSPYAQIVLNLVNLEPPVLTLTGARVARLDVPTPEARVPLAVIVTGGGDRAADGDDRGHAVQVLGDPAAVAPDLVAELAAALPRAVELIVRHPDLPVAEAAEAVRRRTSRPEVSLS